MNNWYSSNKSCVISHFLVTLKEKAIINLYKGGFSMLRRSSTLFILVLIFSVLLVGCKSTNSFGGDFLRDKTAMQNAVKEMKKQGGTPLMLFGDVSFNDNFISFRRQDSRNLEKIDQFIWSTESGWQPARHIVLTEEERNYIALNLYRVDDVNWESVVDFVNNAEKKAKDEGMKDAKVHSVTVHLDMARGKLEFNCNVSGKNQQAFVTGEVKSGGVRSIEFK